MVMENLIYLKNNFNDTISKIKELESRYQRRITLVCVTKSGSDEELIKLAELGACDIGENRPGELARRGALLNSMGYFPGLHQIGHLQRNKIKLVAGRASLIHSLDTLALAEELNKEAKKLGIKIPVLIEINSAKEESKGGVYPEDAEEFFLNVRRLDQIEIRGIMTMGPALEDPQQMRPYFQLTKKIFDEINTRYGFVGEPILSMGMSNSYVVAIEEGANLVRVGRRLFEKDKE